MKRGRELIFHDEKLNKALHKGVEDKKHKISNIKGVKINKRANMDYLKKLIKVYHTETDEVYLYDIENNFVQNSNLKLKPLNRMRFIKIGRNKIREFFNTTDRKMFNGVIYRHFKGKLYAKIDTVIDNEMNIYVLYQALYGDMKIYIRPYEMFASEVDKDKYPDIKQKYRFEPLNNIYSQSDKFYIIINDVKKANVDLNKLSKYLFKIFDGMSFTIQYYNEDERILVTIRYENNDYENIKEKLNNIKSDISNIIDSSVIYYSLRKV